MLHLQVLENEKEKKILQSKIQGYHQLEEKEKKEAEKDQEMQGQIQDGGETNRHPYKMLLIGETGSGKTSFLNLLCNSRLIEELGKGADAAKLEQIMRYNDLTIENLTAMHSKTREVKSYEAEIYRMRTTVIDTPGFGDLRGLEQDKENVKKIIDALKGEDYINCVCLVIYGRQARISASLQYTLSEISTTLPKEVIDNIIVVFTNTASALDCYFELHQLDVFFGKKIDRALYIDNPYCKIEEAKQKATQLTDQIARSLRKSFEDGAKCLRSLQETVKNFKDVHTLHFTRLYDKKQEIERDVIILLAFYDEQIELKMQINTAEEKVAAALHSKKCNTHFKFIKELEVTKPVETGKPGNLLCGVPGCYSNCHMPCYCLTKLYDPEEFKKCKAMGGTETCKVCGHSYRHHYHNEVMFKKFKERKEIIDEAIKKRFEEATDKEQRANYLKQGLQTQKEELLRKKNSLLQELNGKITEFQKLSISNQNYAKVLENQCDVVEFRMRIEVGTQRAQLTALKDDLEKKLKVVNSAIAGHK